MKKEVFLTIPASKKLIGEALSKKLMDYAENHIVVVIKGSTNAFLAQSLFTLLHLDFDITGFYRGILTPEGTKPVHAMHKNDLIIQQGKIIDTDIYGIASQLTNKDIILKGANALNPVEDKCAVLIGNPHYGTMAPISEAVYGRRTKLVHPVGLEKRVMESIDDLCQLTNASDADGLRLSPSPGIPYCEINAFHDDYHLKAHLIAAGGVTGYEGGCLFLLEGNEEDLQRAQAFASANNQLADYEI